MEKRKIEEMPIHAATFDVADTQKTSILLCKKTSFDLMLNY
jgi:hypothetical protein